MANEPGAESTTPSGSSSMGNKAKAAFDEYRKRMEAAGGQMAQGMGWGMGPGMGMYAGQPFGPPFTYGMPAWPYPPPPPMMPPAPAPPGPMWGYPSGTASSAASLPESIGKLLRLGIETLNASLAGGMALAGGIPGSEACGYDPCGHGTPRYQESPCRRQCGGQCECGQHGGYHEYGYHGDWNCYDPCGSWYSGCGCVPSVHNCP